MSWLHARLRLDLRSLRRIIALTAACAMALCGASALADEAAAQRVLALLPVVNGVSADDPIRVVERQDGRLLAEARDLSAVGIAVPRGAAGLIDLATIRNLQVTLDAGTQTLVLTQRRGAIGPNAIDLTTPSGFRPLTPQMTGLALDYDIQAQTGRGEGVALSGYGQLRAFAGGAIASSALAIQPRPGGLSKVVRLDSRIGYSDVEHAVRYGLGDAVTGSTAWSRPVRVIGIQIGSDFSLRPDLVTYPLPDIAGEVAVPSTLDILVNGMKVSERAVEPGDFLLRGVPVANGVGTVGLILRDASGRQQVRNLTLYGSTSLLAAGLTQASVEAGPVRRRYGFASNQYRGFSAIGTWRRGINRHLTVEAHGEAGGGVVSAGTGAVLGLGPIGLLSASAAFSAGSPRVMTAQRGGQFSLTFERDARPVSFYATVRHVTPGYRDVAAAFGDSAPRSAIAANISFDLRRWGSASVGYSRLGRGRRDVVGPQQGSAAPTPATLPRAQLWNASYSLSLRRGVSLFGTWLKGVRGDGAGSFSLGLSMTLGGRTSASGGVNLAQDHRQWSSELVRPAVATHEFGYRLGAAGGDLQRLVAQAEYRADFAQVEAGVERIGDRLAARAGLRGSALLVGDGLFLADAQGGAFAIVSAGAPGVGVFQDHRRVGRTRRDGLLLLTGLRPYEDNLIGIDIDDLPPDVQIDRSDMTIRPALGVSVPARFRVDGRAAVTIRLVDGAGQPLAAGAQARLNRSGDEQPVGYGGLAWIAGVQPHNRLSVRLPGGGTCTAQFDMADFGPGQVIGPIPCLAEGRGGIYAANESVAHNPERQAAGQ